MTFRSHPLKDIIEALRSHNEVLGRARSEYLGLEAEKRHIEANAVKRADGKSHAERVTNAQAEPEWAVFHLKLARAESIYEFRKLEFSILEKEYQAQYLALKMDEVVIKKG